VTPPDSADILVLPPRPDSTAHLLATAAGQRGVAVAQLTGASVPDHLRNTGRAHFYGGPILAGQVAADLGIAPIEPADDWLTRLPYAYTRRDITLTTLGEARWSRTPVFVKPPRDKTLPAGVYADGGRLPGADRYPSDMPVLVSDVVTFVVEYRLFVLDGTVHTASRYAVHGRLDPAPLEESTDRDAVRAFADDFLDACAGDLPSAVVVDIGLTSDPDRGDEHWAVVEANMGWFSSSYAADPDRVLDVVMRAAGPRERLADRDARFLR
jgi:hypothetical protein